MKKKVTILSMLLFILVLGCYTQSYAVVLDNSIITEYCYIMKDKVNNQQLGNDIYNLLLSNEFTQQDIDFSNFNQLIIYADEGQNVNLNYTETIQFMNVPTTTINITSNANYRYSTAVTRTIYTFEISKRQNIINSITYIGTQTSEANTTYDYTNIRTNKFSYILCDTITNNGNYTYYGWNQYYQVLTRGNSATITTSNQPYPIADAYIGNVYNNLDYDVYYYSNGQKVYYSGQVTTYTTPTNHGNDIAIAVNEARDS